MRTCMIGMFAKSLAGHDQNEIYLIIEEMGSVVTVVDGKLKPLEKPKRKKKKHLQLIKIQNEESIRIQKKIESNQTISNEEIKRAIKLLKMGKMEE